ncbi:MAG: zinc dependent phospholipase C family protein [Lachnospiraceae bacterium]|nr:zinc dependent phospholipase C family protein [Lachnospiraceae bacterium]
MPAIFAHDLYGRDVFMELDPEVKTIIRNNRDCYYLGVQGPDVLFFYRPWGKNPINQKGYLYHERPAAELFAHGLEVMRHEKDEKKRNALMAYLLGVSCHFSLDHSLHGEVNRQKEETGFTHAEIETELDRRLLIRAEMEPVRAYTACHLNNTDMTRFVVMHILKEGEAEAKEAIFSFKLITRLFINTGEWFKRFLGCLMKKLGCYEKYYGMVMKQTPLKGLEPTTDLLEQMFLRAVPFGVEMAEGLYSSMKKQDLLPNAFWGNFEGQKG